MKQAKKHFDLELLLWLRTQPIPKDSASHKWNQWKYLGDSQNIYKRKLNERSYNENYSLLLKKKKEEAKLEIKYC